MDKQGQRSVKANERVSHRERGQFCELGREPHQHVCLFTRRPVSFERPNKSSLHVRTCQPTSAPCCEDAVTGTLFCKWGSYTETLTILWDIQSGYTGGNKRLLCVFTNHKKKGGGWQAEASSTERMPVSWAQRSAVKLFRSFRRMAAPASAGAKWKTNWKHVSAHGGQMSANKPLNCSRLWQQDHIVCHQRSTFPFLCLLFVSFSNCDGDCLMRHLRGNRAHSCPEGFADGAGKNSHLLAFAGKTLFPTTFANGAAASFHWEMSSSKCRRQQADRVHGGWISLPFSRVIASHCISFMLLDPINTTNNSLSSTVSDSRC